MSAALLASTVALPPHTRSTTELLPLVEHWLANEPLRFREKVARLFRYSGVERRYSIFSPEEVFAPLSFAQRNQIYLERMAPLAEQALRRALQQAELRPNELDVLITTSCTAVAIPALDVELINNLPLRQDIVRLPIFQMGCAGGVAALVYAEKLLRSGALHNVAVLALESPVATLQRDDRSMANMVSAAIFGDGVACTVLSSRHPPRRLIPRIVDASMYHFYNKQHLMGFKLVEAGLQMVLDPEVPVCIEDHLEQIVTPFLEKNRLNLASVDHFLFHPGGRKILASIDAWLAHYGKHAQWSHQVLRDYGNMSSATALFVLDLALQAPHQAGETALMLSFGPGFTSQRVLLEWAEA